VTGWQSNDGGQGNWNQPSFGPDPHTNQYGTDPYANPYGADPYQANPYGTDPYSGGYDPYQQQPYPPTGGFPAQGYGPPPPPPPPKRSRLPMILSLVAIVIIVGAVVTIVLVNRQDSQPVAQDDPTTTSSPKKTSPGTNSSSTSPPTENGPDDWVTIDNSAAGLTYQVPPDWEPRDVQRQSGPATNDIVFTGNADYGVYECEGNPYVRTFAASGSVQPKNDADPDLAKTLTDFANSFGKNYFGDDAQLEVPAPTEADVEGQTAMTVTTKVTQNVTSPACQATTGEVGLVGILLETDGKPTGVAILVVVNDLAGGPADPKPLDPSVTQQVLKTVRVS
jgi:hypothetical protein